MSPSKLCFVISVVFAGCNILFAAPAPKPSPQAPSPKEIDFSPIKEKDGGRYELTITVTAGKEKYQETSQ